MGKLVYFNKRLIEKLVDLWRKYQYNDSKTDLDEINITLMIDMYI